VSTRRGTIDLFTVAADLSLRHSTYRRGGWSASRPLGGVLRSSPAVASTGPGRLEVYVRGTDDQLWYRRRVGRWSPWRTLGGTSLAGPGAAATRGGRVDVVVTGVGRGVFQRFRPG
jgi:hypothetical protein